MKFLNNVEISGSLTVGGTNVKNQLSTLQTNINTVSNTVNTVSANANKIKTYVGSDGKLHFTNASGADTALNFSKAFNGSNFSDIINKNQPQRTEADGIIIENANTYSIIVIVATMSKTTGTSLKVTVNYSGTYNLLKNYPLTTCGAGGCYIDIIKATSNTITVWLTDIGSYNYNQLSAFGIL